MHNTNNGSVAVHCPSNCMLIAEQRNLCYVYMNVLYNLCDNVVTTSIIPISYCDNDLIKAIFNSTFFMDGGHWQKEVHSL